MKSKYILALSVATLIFGSGCSNHEAHWGYEGETGPTHWGSLNKEFKECSLGNQQSPINIISNKDINLEELLFDYKADSTDVINNGHTVQVNIASGSSVEIDGKKFYLKQFHFHTPSENNINGNKYDLEAHFVHVADDGQIAVVAVMFEEGEENPILKKIWSKFPLEENKKVDLKLSANDIQAIFPKNRDYYKFMGSLTTPPCSENVKWNVFKTVQTVSKEQIKLFFDTFGHPNNRPIQPRNGRVISE